MNQENETKSEVLAFIKKMNEAWTKGDGTALKDFFHTNMVAITPTDRDILRGREPCIAGWQNFAKSVKVHHWEEVDPDVRLYGNTAVVTYVFDMSFDMQGQTIKLGGRDMFVLVKENGRWWAVADQFSPFPGGM